MSYGVALVIAGVVLLPGYIYFLSKFSQVGRMAGRRWFANYSKERKSGTDSSKKA